MSTDDPAAWAAYAASYARTSVCLTCGSLVADGSEIQHLSSLHAELLDRLQWETNTDAAIDSQFQPHNGSVQSY